jgi:Protein kinase domain
LNLPATDAHLAELSDDQRQVLESWLVDFDLTWDEGQLALWVRRLSASTGAMRRPALVEMVKIDLERRWQRGQSAKLDSYVKALPELGPLEQLPADLVLAEYEARQQCGAPVDLAEFARRFPRQADELRRLLGQLRVEATTATSPAHELTTTPGDHVPDGKEFASSAGAAGHTPVSGGLAHCAAALPEKFGRYRILRELGRGAMGTVYLAHDSQLDRPVALKVPQFTRADGPEARQRFLSEARAAATIVHPNVCPVYDAGEINGTLYLTMAYLQGPNLGQLLEAATPLPEQQAASLVRQLSVAVRAAHERGIIHRDLKPSNIMINQQGEPVILDFGLARRLHHDGVRLTQHGQPLGTPAYMSPEQVVGAVHLMGPGCDVYALGVILYQLLTGRLPFKGSVTEVLGQIIAHQPEPPSKLRPGLDPRLEAICLKALSKEIAGRHASMQDLGAALTDYLQSPVAAIPVDSASAASGTARPRPARLGWLWLLLAGGGLAAAGAVAVVLLVSVGLWINSSRGTIQIQLEGPRAEVEVQVDGDRIDSGRLNEPLRLRSGKHHLLVTGRKIQPVSTSFNVATGENPPLRVQLVPQTDGVINPVPAPAAAAPAPVPTKKLPVPTSKKKKRHDDDDRDDR